MQVYLLSMTLEGGATPVWRHLTVPEDVSFGELGEILVVAAGYRGEHSWEFLFSDIRARITNDAPLLEQARFLKSDAGAAYLDGLSEEERENVGKVVVMAAADVPLKPLIEKHKRFRFLYDFTDEWVWNIEFLDAFDAATPAPELRDGLGTAPFEDVGGFGGFYEMIDALTENTPEAEAVRAWMTARGDKLFDKEAVGEALAARRHARAATSE